MTECYEVVIKVCDSFTNNKVGIKADNSGRGKLYRRVAVHILSKSIDYQWEILSEYLEVSRNTIYRDYLYALHNSDIPKFKFAHSRVIRELKKHHRTCFKTLL